MTVGAGPSDLHSLTVAGDRLAYRDSGGPGRPLVLLHGGFLDHRMWNAQVPYFATEFRVLAPDAHGHGGSDNASGPFRPADDVAALLHHLDLGPAVVAGVSMGGGTAVDVALEHPDLVRALVVTAAGTSEPEFADPWVLGVQTEQQRAFEAGDPAAWVEAYLQFAAGPRRTLDEVDPQVVALMRDMASSTLAKHASPGPDLRILPTDTWERAAGIKAPVLTLNGELASDDHLAMAERLARTVPDGRTATVDGTAHYPNMERPDLFNALVRDFLAELP
ncbi:alpha/beta fold hydrolase [Streptomyces cavernicola]|uniref:Alpha/beta hydrolase n=1 Tax=Streptomyces cavernicola TaxID=3043613 RepID=A0ABT6S6R7_9ACTN|nr:alpha/beta hydrolase [Streptomyces sp. B-S-A6]MDI3403732.1 alpha/beta hydrolase [Streptomyces sp. B-S-A6]